MYGRGSVPYAYAIIEYTPYVVCVCGFHACRCAVPTRYEFVWSVRLGGASSPVPLYLPSTSRRAVISAGILPAVNPNPNPNPNSNPNPDPDPDPNPAPNPDPYPNPTPNHNPNPNPISAGILPAGRGSTVTLHARAVMADGSRLNATASLVLTPPVEQLVARIQVRA